MSPLFMDTGYELNSPGSLSAEESHSNTAGSEREGDGQQVGHGGTKRRDKNRDAARKSRRKQTKRADELHEELQCLERSNSALQKEIALLKKDLHLYATALERHKPVCRLLVFPPADCQTGSSPPAAPPQASSSTLAAAPSLSTSLTSILGLHTPAPTATTFTSSTGSPAGLFTSSSCVTVPYSTSFSIVPAPHSLFSKSPPSLTASRPTNATPACTSLASNPVPPSSFTTAAQPQSGQDNIHEISSLSANASFSTPYPDTLDAFLMKQDSFPAASSNAVPPYSHLAAENAGLVVQGCPMIDPGQSSGNPVNPSQRCSLLPSTLQDAAPQSLSVSRQSNPEPPPASAFALKPGYGGHITPMSLLSLLTVPDPLNVSQTSSSSFDEPLSQHLPQLPPQRDPSRDLSLSELLEINDWILQ